MHRLRRVSLGFCGASAYGSNLKHIVEDSVQDMAEQSACKMSSAPEMQKLSAAPDK